MRYIPDAFNFACGESCCITNLNPQCSRENKRCPTKQIEMYQQRSVLSPHLFDIYIAYLPETTAMKCGHADDLALLKADRDWNNIAETLKPRHVHSLNLVETVATQTE